MFHKKKQPSLYNHTKWGAKLGLLAVVVLAFLLWSLGLAYEHIGQDSLQQQFQKIIDALDHRKYYSAMKQLWFLGTIICSPLLLIAGLLVGVVLGVKQYSKEKEEFKIERQRELEAMAKGGIKKKSIPLLLIGAIVGIIVSLVGFFLRKLKLKRH